MFYSKSINSFYLSQKWCSAYKMFAAVFVGVFCGLLVGVSEFLSRITTNSKIAYYSKDAAEKEKSLEITVKTIAVSSVLIGLATGLALKNRDSSHIPLSVVANILIFGGVLGGAVSEGSRGFVGLSYDNKPENAAVKKN